jgi:hypothetical protein
MLLLGTLGVGTAVADAPANTPFWRTWQYTDGPVAAGLVSRSWIWGPEAYTATLTEPYAESPDGKRWVQYYDKSRMEITHPGDNPNTLWYVTNGLLVMELISGQLQLGDFEFDEREPAGVNVAGDADDPTGPTYASFTGLLGATGAETSAITRVVDRAGNVTTDAAFADYEIAATLFTPETQHYIADPFWALMNSTGLVSDGGMAYEGALFPNAYYATGYPVTEAYWANVKVADAYKDVLIQCFERRCLTYTPDNAPEWRVEMGNVGQHYVNWRYGPPVAAELFFVDVGDTRGTGELIGCQDSMAGVPVQLAAADTPELQVTRALEGLLGFEFPMYGDTGYRNALSGSRLVVDSVEITNGDAIVELSGTVSVAGICDEPRFVQQLLDTVLQFDEVDIAQIFVNGTPLEDLFDNAGDTAQIYLVAIGDEGASGIEFGCDDSAVPVFVPHDISNGPIVGALNALFHLGGPDYGESGLYNVFYNSTLTADSVVIEDGLATVNISGQLVLGGVCDNPRVKAQIEYTVLGFPGVTSVEVFLNGVPLDEVLSLM